VDKPGFRPDTGEQISPFLPATSTLLVQNLTALPRTLWRLQPQRSRTVSLRPFSVSPLAGNALWPTTPDVVCCGPFADIHDRVFTYRNHWLGRRQDSPFCYIFWREPLDRRVFRSFTKIANLEHTKELLVGFAGSDIPPTAKGREWLRIRNALDAYARHMHKRPSYPMVEHIVCHVL
jgi:hypothetical protein